MTELPGIFPVQALRWQSLVYAQIMSLWTPYGEHDVPPEKSSESTAAPSAPQMPSASSLDDLNDEERARAEAMAAEMAEARSRLLETPIEVVVANHAMGLYELAAIHLSNDPPDLPSAKLAIDALGAVVDSTSGRLGDHEETLKAARSQIQLAFVDLSQRSDNQDAQSS